MFGVVVGRNTGGGGEDEAAVQVGKGLSREACRGASWSSIKYVQIIV